MFSIYGNKIITVVLLVLVVMAAMVMVSMVAIINASMRMMSSVSACFDFGMAGLLMIHIQAVVIANNAVWQRKYSIINL